MLAANIWHWWIGVIMAVAGGAAVLGLVVGYLKQVTAQRYPAASRRPRARALTESTSLDALVARCTFPPAGTASIRAPFRRARLDGARRARRPRRARRHRPSRRPPAARRVGRRGRAGRGRIAEQLGVEFVLHVVDVGPGPNLEARARDARRAVLPDGVMTGHTADDQAETVLLRLLRGSGSDGLAAIEPGWPHPILALRRRDTRGRVRGARHRPGARPVERRRGRGWRNRVRHELLPLAADIAGRDLAPILARTADAVARRARAARRARRRDRPDRRPCARRGAPAHSPGGRSGAGSPTTVTRRTPPRSNACSPSPAARPRRASCRGAPHRALRAAVPHRSAPGQ